MRDNVKVGIAFVTGAMLAGGVAAVAQHWDPVYPEQDAYFWPSPPVLDMEVHEFGGNGQLYTYRLLADGTIQRSRFDGPDWEAWENVGP